MKKILMISYYYPPLADVGSLRALGFSKYLPAVGWEPYVLSVKNPDKLYCTIGREDPPENVRVFYVRSLFNLYKITGKANGLITKILRVFGMELKGNIVQYLFCIPDIFVGWIIPCYIKGLQIIDRYNIDVIYVSCKPFSQAITGIMLKKTRNKPLVLDFRDPISFPKHLFFKGTAAKLKLKIIRKIENCVLKHTDRLIVTTDETKERYLSIYPSLDRMISRIYNGYYDECLPKPNSKQFDKFTIIYTGNFYRDEDPSDLFFMALQKTIAEQVVPRERIRFLYLGAISRNENWLQRTAEKYDLKDIILAPGMVPREESMKNISRSSMLLLRILPPMISTKLYEGLATGLPLLASINEGEVANLIRRYSKNSYVITSNDVDDIASAIKDAYHRWDKGTLEKSTNEEFLQNFNKKALTKQFARILEEVYQANQAGK